MNSSDYRDKAGEHSLSLMRNINDILTMSKSVARRVRGIQYVAGDTPALLNLQELVIELIDEVEIAKENWQTHHNAECDASSDRRLEE